MTTTTMTDDPGVDGAPATRDGVARRFRELLDERELSQSAAADLVGCTQSMISYVASGTKLPSPELAARIEDALGFPADLWRDVAVAEATERATADWHERGG